MLLLAITLALLLPVGVDLPDEFGQAAPAQPPQTQQPQSASVFHQELAWSPDGKRIAFIVGKYPDTSIYVMRADGSNVKNLVGNE